MDSKLQKLGLKGKNQNQPFTIYELGAIEGWNLSVGIVERLVEPLWNEVGEFEHLIGFIEGVYAYRPTEPTEKFRALMGAKAIELGDILNRADVLNKTITQTFHWEQDYIDLSLVQQYRNAMIAISTGQDESGDGLLPLIATREAVRANYDIVQEMRKRKTRARLDPTQYIADQMQKMIDRYPRRKLKWIADRVKTEFDLHYSIDTIISYYYRARGE